MKLNNQLLMSSNINENETKLNSSSNIEQNIFEINISLKHKKLEEDKKNKDLINGILVNDINANINNINLNFEHNNLNKTNKELNISEQKDKIFKVNYRNTHDGEAQDNVKQCIITSFINFFINFINFIVGKKLNTNKEIFHISYQLKSKIKIKNILELTVKQLLLIESQIKTQNDKDNNKKYNIDNSNLNQINKIRGIIGSSLDKLFETPVINLFKDIYAKNDFKNQNEKEIDLKIYGVEGIIFKLTDQIPTYEKLKENNKDNQKKINLMDEIVNQKIINPKKELFKVKKK